MSEDTDNTDLVDIDGKTQRKKTTTSIPQDLLDRLKTYAIIEREPPYSVIERLCEEHDIKTMRRVVAKRVR
jgi:hypothetical protein